jgi:hypothetical protein
MSPQAAPILHFLIKAVRAALNRAACRKEHPVVASKTPPVVGVFEDHAAAERAVEALRRAGFGQEQIGVVVRHGDAQAAPRVEADTEPETGAAVGAVTGGVLGSLLGVAVALTLPGVGAAMAAGILAGILGGATLGITGGGLVGALIGLGLSEEEARHYEREFHAGRTLVTVQADGRHADAAAILSQCGAFARQTVPAATV